MILSELVMLENLKEEVHYKDNLVMEILYQHQLKN